MITDSVIGDTVDSDITMEELGALIRGERNSGSLLEVRRDLYPAMLRLLDKQSRECERQIGIDIGSLASAAANERRKKIQQSIKLVIEYRMSKVAALAIRTAMGCVNSIDGLPPEERQYFDSVLEASRVHWANTERKKKSVMLMDLESVNKPASDVSAPSVSMDVQAPKPVIAETLKDIPIIPDDEMEMDMGDIDFPEDFSEFPESEVLPEAVNESKQEQSGSVEDAPVEQPADVVSSEDVPDVVEVIPGPEPEATQVDTDEDYDDNLLLTIHVMEDIPEFVGPTRDYRLRKDDVVRMPAGMANVLINRKMAVKLI